MCDASVSVETPLAASLRSHAPQPPRQLAQQRERDARRLLQNHLEVLAADHEQVGILHRDHVRRPGLFVDQRHLAEEVALAQHRERSEEHTSELQSLAYLVCRLLLEKKKKLLA